MLAMRVLRLTEAIRTARAVARARALKALLTSWPRQPLSTQMVAATVITGLPLEQRLSRDRKSWDKAISQKLIEGGTNNQNVSIVRNHSGLFPSMLKLLALLESARRNCPFNGNRLAGGE